MVLISNGVKQGCILPPKLFSIFFSIMLRVAKGDLPDGIYIRFRTDGSLFNLLRLLARTKTIEELITELLFADDCALLALTEEALQHIVNRFSDAAKNFGLTISLKKTEVLYQSPPRVAYISIDGIKLNAVEHFTYLGSVISNDATVSKDLDNRLSKASSSFGRRRVTRSASSQRSRCTGPSSFPQEYSAETWVLYRKQIRLLERFHQRCLRSILGIKWQDHVSNEEVLKRASLSSLESILLQVQLRWAGHVTRMEDVHLPKAVFFSELQGKRNRGAPRKRYKDQLKRQLAQAGISHQSWQQEAADRDSWRSSVRKASCEFEAEKHKAAKEKRRRQKERAASLPSSSQTFVCPKCGRGCASRISLYSHQRVCMN